ncbi:hypothetical protein [Aidingimonas lacisalsi]|uniref:hypothetical protein n=1 Tax=Aidingimonas lacisalsi TaxID=2604086 RepID=UPI0013754655|nr:hypothetical protein [Aidingimonas lacisalsi]
MTGKRIGPIAVALGLAMLLLGIVAARLFLFVGVAVIVLGCVLWLTRPNRTKHEE